MADRQDIDHILKNWSYEARQVIVRVVKTKQGRDVLQMRLDMGLLQLEMEGRPDGDRPQGFETYHDYLLSITVHEGDDFKLTEEQCQDIDREFVQFYHRRVCWLALREFGKAVKDADHTLGMMDLCKKYSPDEEWALSHEQYRPYVLFHRTQALALSKLEEGGPDMAIEQINQGLDTFRSLFAEYEAEDHFDDDELVTRLVELRESLREHFEVGRTLQEQLSDAVAAEEYERAAKLRDELHRRSDEELHGRGEDGR